MIVAVLELSKTFSVLLYGLYLKGVYMHGNHGNDLFYRTQVNLGSDLWVRKSVSESVQHLV